MECIQFRNAFRLELVLAGHSEDYLFVRITNEAGIFTQTSSPRGMLSILKQVPIQAMPSYPFSN